MGEMRLTKARRAYLERLRDFGPAKRQGRSNVGYSCMHAGWTEWDYRREDGSPVSVEQAKVEYGPRWLEAVHSTFHERITPAGREALRSMKGGEG